MKILYHHRTRGAGAEGVHIMGIVNALRSMGHEVHLLSFPGADPEKPVTPSTPQPKQKKSLLGWLASQTKHMPEFVFEFFELAYNMVGGHRLKKLTNAVQPDLIYERYSLFMFIGVWFAKKRGIPIVLEVNDSALVERVRPLTFVSFAKKVEAWIFRNATGLVFISNYFHDIAKENYGNIAPAKICPNSADISQFTPDAEARERVRKQYNVQDKVVCGYVGAFVYWHGIQWFMEEVAPKLKQYPNLVLLLVGDGAVFPEIQNIVTENNLQDQVILTGRVPHKEVGDLISAMDYGILPDSNHYGSPMKLLEMMAMEVALVSPGFGPVREVVEHNQTGWLFEPKDKQAAVQLVLDLSNQPEETERVGKQARKYIIENRQWTHNAQDVLSLVPGATND
ncbi:glycosyltransferase family 4 protein [Teredinibacter sp. KSP-S5-2]|uniref:glycosyltransferase family 4 protein n=1 Tax=Teredinibacter sp. KSP-S5-2 TaxID=3034506 RepID=UPI0029348554|nr:glycosyltransferase family 4 protein [Teredinibacter sp. KSP-S5-2]WNO09042.1 glycosyltransferase family 4 protein [Teredinibacter sp. KSP-S5-2]